MMARRRDAVIRRLITGGVVILLAGGLAAAELAAAPAARAAARQAPEPQARQSAAASGPAGVRAPYAEVADAATGADLWSRSSATQHPMGSIAKVMTAYVVIKAGGLGTVITVPSGITAYDTANHASTAGLVPGERYTARQLLIALLLPSGCDAAYTLASAYGPGIPAFIAKMNAAARSLGLARTHFSDFSGLSIPGPASTYSTAGNLVALGRAAMALPDFRQVVGMRSFRLAAGGGHRAHTWVNLNPLLGSYPGAIGIKTGYTAAAGDCLLFAATRGGRTLVGVVLHSSSSPTGLSVAASDAATMLNWAFAR
jgi:D-alanyl-D-alanine carboxypeptidase (penicillin-binding protein 5/6)